MGTRTALKLKEVFMQYSKKMCTRVTIFWMVYRVLNFVVVLLRPEVANAMVALCEGVDTIMIVNMSAYTLNSGTEKVAIAFTKRKQEEDNNKEETDSDEESGDNG